MTLVVYELEAAGLTQEVTPSKNTIVEAVRPHIMIHDCDTGSLSIEIYDSGDSLIATSNSVDISSISSAAYYHGYVRFNINAYLAKNETYSLKLVGAGGYSFSPASYAGWVNGYDLAKYPLAYTPGSSLSFPFDYEIWARSPK